MPGRISLLCVRRYVQQVSKGAEAAAKAHNLANTAAERKKKKEQEEAAAREMANLFAPAIKQPKPPPGGRLRILRCRRLAPLHTAHQHACTVKCIWLRPTLHAADHLSCASSHASVRDVMFLLVLLSGKLGMHTCVSSLVAMPTSGGLKSPSLRVSWDDSPSVARAAGVDPKSIVCEHFRHGQCTKGHKCKYSHDLNVERKTAKAALYDEEEGKEVQPCIGRSPLSSMRLGHASPHTMLLYRAALDCMQLLYSMYVGVIVPETQPRFTASQAAAFDRTCSENLMSAATGGYGGLGPGDAGEGDCTEARHREAVERDRHHLQVLPGCRREAHVWLVRRSCLTTQPLPMCRLRDINLSRDHPWHRSVAPRRLPAVRLPSML